MGASNENVNSTRNIVILGGNFAGVSVAHYVLRHVLPSLKNNATDSANYKVILISPSTHVFWKIGAPRALASPDMAFEKSFFSIPEAFQDYKPSIFEFVQAEAVGVDEAAKVVKIQHQNPDTTDEWVQYMSLVIATGTKSKSPLWTLHGSHLTTQLAFEDLHKRLPDSKSVLIVGGGAAGIETAGEIAHTYKGKALTILSGGKGLLFGLRNPRIGEIAEDHLNLLGVKVIHNVKLRKSTEGNGTTSFELSDGTSGNVDVFIDATGGVPNSAFLPASWLNEHGRVLTNGETLRATVAPQGVYSIGDVASYSRGGILDVQSAVAPLCYSIWSDLMGIDVSLQNDGHLNQKLAKATFLQEKKYKQIQSDMQFVPVGPQGGVGVLFGWRTPSWVVWLIKSRTFFFNKAPGLVAGAGFLKP